MGKLIAGVMVCLCFTVTVFASESIYDVYGTVLKIEEWPSYLGSHLQGHITTITVNGQSYPLSAQPKVFRATNYPAMYPKVPARFSEVNPGSIVNLRLHGHSVIEIILGR